MNDEIWKDVRGFEGLYKISNFGRVYSLHTYNKMKPHFKKPTWNKWRGYFYIDLFDKQKCTQIRLHRLIAINFLKNPNNYPEINHIDGNKRNNKVSNLEWCDKSQNMKHAYKLGLMPHPQGKRKLTEKIVKRIRKTKAENPNLQHWKLAKMFNISQTTITQILNRNRWGWLK